MGMTTIPSKADAELLPGCTIEIDYCAGGSFAQVIMRDAGGARMWSKVREPFEAMRIFESLRAG